VTRLYDSRWPGPNGIGRFATEVVQRIPGLQPLEADLPLFHPLDPWRLAREIRRIAPAVFFSPGFNAPVATPGVPLVFTLHDLNYVHFAANTTALKRAYFATIVKPACRRAARVLTVSEFSRRQIIEWAHIPEERVRNVSNGVAGSFVPGGTRHSPGFPYLLFVGSQASHKNLRRLVAALARSGAAREVKLLVTGQPTADTARWLAAENLGSHVEFTGLLPDDELPAYYRGAVALAMPSLFEGFGLPVVEAMACGTAVLTSDATSLPEVAGDAALIVNPTDVDAIAGAIDRLVFDRTLREDLGAKGIVRARGFSWDETARAIVAVLDEAERGG
jgi:glycosyltransferase involved in cell wall biosynthesis